MGLREEMSFKWEVTGEERCHWGRTLGEEERLC